MSANTQELIDFLAQVRRSVRQQRCAMDQAINDFGAGASTDCLSAVDSDFLKAPGSRMLAQRRLYQHGWMVAYLMATNIGDHLAAIADTATPDEPRVFAHMTLARAALEGAARVAYLLHPSGTLPDRLLRAAFVLLSSAEEELNAVPDLATFNLAMGEAANERATSRHKAIRHVLDESEIVVKHERRGGRRLHSVSWADSPDQEQEAPNVTRLLKQLLPKRPSAYNVGSGAVHSQPWVLDVDGAFDPQTRTLNCPFDPFALARSVDLAISASILAMETFAEMFGQDPSHERTKAQRREMAVSLLAQSLLSVSEGNI